MKLYKVPSVSIAVINGGKIEWAKAYGYSDIGNRKLADPNTLYQVASISKSVNGFGIMRLIETGNFPFRMI
jgi:CubicO group peptidase (beta-lactamase class C family)